MKATRVWAIAALAVVSVSAAPAAAQRARPAATSGPRNGSYHFLWNDTYNGSMFVVRDGNFVCGAGYQDDGGIGYLSGTTDGAVWAGKWSQGNAMDLGDFTLNFAAAGWSGHYSDSEGQPQSLPLNGSDFHAAPPRRASVAGAYRLHWGNEHITLRLTQTGSQISGTYSGASEGRLHGTLVNDVLIGVWEDRSPAASGRFIWRFSVNNYIQGVYGADMTSCINSGRIESDS